MGGSRIPAVAIRAVLFDFGGVILSSPFDAFARYERQNGLPEGTLRTINSTNPDVNAWARLERNELGFAEFSAAFSREAADLGYDVDGGEVLALLAGDVRPAMVEAVRRCRERFKTALLTNNFLSLESAERPVDHSDVLGLFDVIVESSRIGVRKPDPRFYELACQLLEIEPPEAVFLDDLGVNLKPARAMGMATIKVADPHEALRELSEVVGLDLA
jgi:putative hydrolase of the HAD superfamily